MTVRHLRLVGADVSPDPIHRTRRFAFDPAINPAAQRVLVDLHLDVERQMRGIVSCSATFDAANGEWVQHSLWAAD